MQRDHRREHRLGQHGGAALGQRALVPARQAQLDEAAGADGADEHEEEDRRSGHRQLHPSSSISLVSPGPKAASTPCAPAGGRRCVSHSCSTNSTDALDWLP